ncbi:MAG: aspartate carbamoyltransferase regulatory subunit [Anaerovoracaceae bacterium]|jgi:aspartate carbamoyltransferase regulatory subunit
MNIDGVSNGIVLDHIKAGTSLKIYELLHLDKLSCSVAVIQNAHSTKYGKKDIIKIDEMIDLDMDILGYLDPGITVNIIRDGALQSKKHVELPMELTNVIFCRNPRCITSVEQEIPHRFRLADREKKIYRCVYCDVEYRPR